MEFVECVYEVERRISRAIVSGVNSAENTLLSYSFEVVVFCCFFIIENTHCIFPPSTYSWQ